ncbi:MAG: class I SAM-dependent methyltransferase, partial [Kiritimatiellia bacterium]
MTTSSTDKEWEKLGRDNPYYGVVSMDRFKNSAMDEQAFADFFQSGEDHVSFVQDTLTQAFGDEPGKERALDFGCGVGRLALPLAKRYARVTGVDISPSMLQEAKKNAEKFGQQNLEWISTLDDLSASDRFDLIHCFIVFQH